ncbi:MAG: hypothetical protein COB93_00175 [Sneathiella sp.]|nr:MAG: hypothetical protein COB93_00175 [Sneathiella sp.]
MTDCCRIKGGRIEFRFNGQIYEGEGDVTIMPTNTTREEGATTSGKAIVRATPRSYGFEIENFVQTCDNDPIDLWYGCDLDATVVEVENGTRHLFTGGMMVGDPQANISQGQLSGMKFIADDYQKRSS